MSINRQAVRILKRKEHLKSERSNFDSLWDETLQYTLPIDENVYDWKVRSTGDQKMIKLYDSSAVHYNELLGAALHSMMTNPFSHFFGLNTGNPKRDKKANVAKYLYEMVQVAHSIINNSNFHTEIYPAYLATGAIGNAILLMEEDSDELLNFTYRPIYTGFIDTNHKGQVDTIILEYFLTSDNMLEKYGEKAFDTKTLEKFKKDPNKKWDVTHIVQPRTAQEIGKKKGVKSFPYASIHVMDETKQVIKESGFEYQPFAIIRFVKSSSEKYARGPGTKSLPDTKMVNQYSKVTIRGAQKAIDPPVLIPDDGSIRINTAPGGLMPYRAGSKDRPEAFPTGNPQIGLEMIQERRQRIKENFFIDQLQLRDGPQMTAKEVDVRTSENLRLLGPVLGRMNHELLKPLVAFVLYVMGKKGLMPLNPPEELEGITPQVQFTSQIAKAQRLDDAINIQQFMQSLVPIVQIDPSAADWIDTEQYVGVTAEIHGAPLEIIRTKASFDKVRQEKAQAARAAAEAEASAQAGQNAQKGQISTV